ncbi:MAG: hypothetical protein ABJ004_06515 [Cyclobacteriaceae bacterium]
MGMRLVLILMLLVNISTSQGLLAQRTGAHEVSVMSSAIRISGETNVNKYSCELFIPTITDTLSVNSHHSALRIAFDSLILAYQVTGFDCGLEAMTQDFRGILKSDVYPQFYLQIHEIDIHEESEGFDQLDVEAQVSITIAGTQRRITVTDAAVINQTASDLVLKGVQAVRMTDFGIEPPTRFWGALRAYDELVIHFDITMHTEEQKKGRIK